MPKSRDGSLERRNRHHKRRSCQLGNSSAHRNFDTTITSVLSDNSSLAPLCCEHPPERKDESQTGKCSDDGRGSVKTLSGRLARKLQRSASLVNAGLSKQIQTELDAANVDRCDFVEICCSDVPCLTEAMQRRGLSSFSLLRSDGVGNHLAKTREKILSWLSEKRPQKAWLSPPVVTHQNNSTRCSLRSRQIFRQFFGYAAAVLSNGGRIYSEWPAKCIGWSSVELPEFRAQQKSCGRELFMTACDSCVFAKRENNLLERHRWQFLTSDPRFKEYMSFQCQDNHEHVWNQTSEGKREYPSAMIRRLVNGFVHDLRPPQLHMFLSEADRVLSSSPAFFVASSAQETEKDTSPAERERVRKMIHRLHASGGHVSKTSLRLLLQRRGCPVWMQHMVDQLQCDSCLESSDAHNAQQVSLATPLKLWQAVKVDIFRSRRLTKERVSLHTTWMQPENCRRVHAFWKEILVSVSSRTVRLSFHTWPRIGCSISRSFSFCFRTLVDVSSVTNCVNGQVSKALVS